MRVETRKGRFWSRLIRPLLWPTLTAQALLVVLCVVVGLTCWWLMPTQATWGITFWLLLALLVGSGLNVAVFLLLLRQRLQACETGFEATFARLEAALAHQAHDLPSDPGLHDAATGRPLKARLEAIGETVEALVAQWRVDLATSRDAERRLAADLQARQSRLERLEAGRARAREESRLKSDYLLHLQQTLAPLMAALDEALASDPSRRGDDQQRAALQALRERLAETAVLLENLGEKPVEEGARVPAHPGRVLIVDDGPVNLMLARQVLKRQEGLRVATATSGAQALALLTREPFDLVFMDIFMADMDGVETCRAWREREATLARETRSVVVALTANAGEADRQRFLEAGMDDVLAKPYRPQTLLETLHRWLPGVLDMEMRP